MPTRLIALLLLALLPAAAVASGFQVREAHTRLDRNVYTLNARVDYNFSRDTLEALDSGVPLTVRLDIEVEKKRPWWWFDAEVATLEQRYQLHYYPLSNQYLIRNLNSDALYAYPSLEATLAALGDVEGLPLLDHNLIESGGAYQVQVRAALDIESLPAPLRPLAYLTPGWHLSSDWFTCSLVP